MRILILSNIVKSLEYFQWYFGGISLNSRFLWVNTMIVGSVVRNSNSFFMKTFIYFILERFSLLLSVEKWIEIFVLRNIVKFFGYFHEHLAILLLSRDFLESIWWQSYNLLLKNSNSLSMKTFILFSKIF